MVALACPAPPDAGTYADTAHLVYWKRGRTEDTMGVTVYRRGYEQIAVPDADDVKAENWTAPELSHGSAATTHAAVLACYAGPQVVARFMLPEVTGYRLDPCRQDQPAGA